MYSTKRRCGRSKAEGCCRRRECHRAWGSFAFHNPMYQLLLLSCLLGAAAGLLPSTAFQRAETKRLSTIIVAQKSDKEGAGDGVSDLSWLREAMASSDAIDPDGVVFVDSKPGISGFAVDNKLGFVVVMVGGDRATYAVVSPKDKKQVRSAEALCLVQLAGGLDLGTPVLPPDILARLVADETGQSARELRQQVKLKRVDVLANEMEKVEEEKPETPPAIEMTEERQANIEVQAPKVFAAINKLSGLTDATLEQVVEAMKLFADESGKLDRPAFTSLLDSIRRALNETKPSKVKFMLTVALNDMELKIPAPSPVVAVGLALRYNVDVVVSKECQIEGFDIVEISSRFPAFRPIKELEEDARIMDGFIPSMFNEATAPKNDDKM
jgi:hypothetical protein